VTERTATPIDPDVSNLAQAVFTAVHADRSRNEDNARRATSYYSAVWTIYAGSRVHAKLKANGQDMVVGYTWTERSPGASTDTTRRLRERGRVDYWTVLGVPVIEDPRGPLGLWRLAESDGLTIVWGEFS
jgi:hypothetical protein